MVRKFVAAALASALLVSSGTAAFAASDRAALAPGKAAGVHQAALHAPMWIWIAGIGFVALGIGLAVSGNGDGSSSGSTTGTGL